MNYSLGETWHTRTELENLIDASLMTMTKYIVGYFKSIYYFFLGFAAGQIAHIEMTGYCPAMLLSEYFKQILSHFNHFSLTNKKI